MVAATSIRALNEYTSHAFPDPAHVSKLAAAMTQTGWVGAPVLTFTADVVCAVTGTHRIAAARQTGTDVPTLDLAEVTDDTMIGIAERVEAATGYWPSDLEIATIGFAQALTDEQIAAHGLDTDDVAWMITATR